MHVNMTKISLYYGLLVFSLSWLSITSTNEQNVDNQTVTELNTKAKPFLTVSSDSKDIRFKVYSDPSNPDNFREIVIGDVGTLERSGLVAGEIKMLLGPFGGDQMYMDLKNDYLSQGVTNIVFVDSGGLSEPAVPFPIGFLSYFAALKNVPKVGKKGAAFINFLVKNKKSKNAKDIHLVGFSLGAHKASSIGRYLQEGYNMTVGRLTGIDVAGPFSKFLGKNKFNKKYGKFVDAIHSDIDGFGTPESLGHADFFINGGKGKDQPDCGGLDPFSTIICGHTTAFFLYRKSVTKEKTFIGCTCDPRPVPILPLICGQKKGKCEDPTRVGEYCPTRARGNYFVKVTEKLGVREEMS